MSSRRHLDTERALEEAGALERMNLAAALELFDREEQRVLAAVAGARPAIMRAIELVVARLARGGRLIYVGAGTSGRLGLLDAVECPPTFGSDPERVQGRLAGGASAFVRAVEGAEDSFEGGRAAVGDVTEGDVVFAISAGGTTPFVHGALQRAAEVGAGTVFLACVPADVVPDEADVSIRLATGPEVLAGSTRLKAGTATKLVLNRVSTLAMARLGHVHAGRMVDVAAGGNAKLAERARAILEDLTGLAPAEAARLLARAGGDLKRATVMHALGLDAEAAAARLERAGGSLHRALERDQAAQR